MVEETKFEAFGVPDHAMARMRADAEAGWVKQCSTFSIVPIDGWGWSFDGPPTRRLSELDAGTLSELCDGFRRDAFAKAGLDDPRGGEHARV